MKSSSSAGHDVVLMGIQVIFSESKQQLQLIGTHKIEGSGGLTSFEWGITDISNYNISDRGYLKQDNKIEFKGSIGDNEISGTFETKKQCISGNGIDSILGAFNIAGRMQGRGVDLLITFTGSNGNDGLTSPSGAIPVSGKGVDASFDTTMTNVSELNPMNLDTGKFEDGVAISDPNKKKSPQNKSSSSKNRRHRRRRRRRRNGNNQQQSESKQNTPNERSKSQNVNKSKEYTTLHPQMDDRSLNCSDDENEPRDSLLNQWVGARSSSPSREQMKYRKGIRVIKVGDGSNKKGTIVGTDGEYTVEYDDDTKSKCSEDGLVTHYEFDHEGNDEGSETGSEVRSKSNKEELASSDDDDLSVNTVDKEEGVYKTSAASLNASPSQEKRGATGEDNGHKKVEGAAVMDIPEKRQQPAAAVASKKAEANKMEIDESPSKKDMGSNKMEVSPDKKGNGADVGSTPNKNNKKKSKQGKGKGIPSKKGGNGGGNGGSSKGSSKGKGDRKSTGGTTAKSKGGPKKGDNNEVGILNHPKSKPILTKMKQEKTKVVAAINQLDEVKKMDKASLGVKTLHLKTQLEMVRTNDECMSDELREKVYEPWEKACKESLEELKLVKHNEDELDWNKLSVAEFRKIADLFSL